MIDVVAANAARNDRGHGAEMLRRRSGNGGGRWQLDCSAPLDALATWVAQGERVTARCIPSSPAAG
jgi:hypothetical protein